MFFEKRKLLLVKYKKDAQSLRYIDRQIAITGSENFDITIKNTKYFFSKYRSTSYYSINSENGQEAELVDFNKAIYLKHEDGSSIAFTLHEDFLYALDFTQGAYIMFAIIANIVLGLGIQILI